jgi:hypothetical protein
MLHNTMQYTGVLRLREPNTKWPRYCTRMLLHRGMRIHRGAFTQRCFFLQRPVFSQRRLHIQMLLPWDAFTRKYLYAQVPLRRDCNFTSIFDDRHFVRAGCDSWRCPAGLKFWKNCIFNL